MTVTDTDWPAPTPPPPPQPPPKSHKLRTALLILGALWVIGTLMGTSSSSGSGSGSGSTTRYTTPTTFGADSKCSIWNKNYTDCIETKSHEQLNNYYDDAETCDIEAPRYLQCLNDAYHENTR